MKSITIAEELELMTADTYYEEQQKKNHEISTAMIHWAANCMEKHYGMNAEKLEAKLLAELEESEEEAREHNDYYCWKADELDMEYLELDCEYGVHDDCKEDN